MLFYYYTRFFFKFVILLILNEREIKRVSEFKFSILTKKNRSARERERKERRKRDKSKEIEDIKKINKKCIYLYTIYCSYKTNFNCC